MDGRTKRVIAIVVQVVVLGAIGVLAYRQLSAGMKSSDFLHLRFSVPYLIAAWAGLLGYYLAYAFGAHLVLRLLGETNSTPVRAFKLNYATNIGKYLPGAIWPAVGRMSLGPKLGLSRRAVAPGMVLEMGLSVAGGLLVFFASLAFGGRMPSGTQWWHWALLAGCVVIGLLPPVFRRVLALGFKLAKVDADVPHLSFAATLGLVLYFAFAWVLAGIGFQFYTLALVAGAPVTWIPYMGAYAAACVGGLVIVFAPGGIGVREGVLTVLLAPLVGTGPAAVVGFSARVWSALLELALAGIALLLPNPPGVADDGDATDATSTSTTTGEEG
jgi:glycosyltransferase 2 family protein